MVYPYEGGSTAGIDPGHPMRVLMGDQQRSLKHAPPPTVPQDPRLHAIDSAIRTTTERLRAHVQGLDMKADAIVGLVPQDDGAKGVEATPVNGALDQIEMSLRALKDAVTALGFVERRFDGLA